MASASCSFQWTVEAIQFQKFSLASELPMLLPSTGQVIDCGLCEAQVEPLTRQKKRQKENDVQFQYGQGPPPSRQHLPAQGLRVAWFGQPSGALLKSTTAPSQFPAAAVTCYCCLHPCTALLPSRCKGRGRGGCRSVPLLHLPQHTYRRVL